MQVIGVVDVLGGQAVHACAGHRERYVPVESVAGFPIPRGDALALARAYVERLGLSELYAADLDAILGPDSAGRGRCPGWRPSVRHCGWTRGCRPRPPHCARSDCRPHVSSSDSRHFRRSTCFD